MNNHKTAGQGIVPYLNPLFFFLPTWEEVVPDSTDVMRAAPTGVCTGYDETKNCRCDAHQHENLILTAAGKERRRELL